MNNSLREKVTEYIVRKYESKPENLWARYPEFAVFRHTENKKWFAILMIVAYKKLNIEKDGEVQIINVKLSDWELKDFLITQNGFCKSYHMAGSNWITILLDGSVGLNQITKLIDDSFETTLFKKTSKKCAN